MWAYIQTLLPYLSTIVMAFVMFFLGKAQSKAEISKLKAETKKTTGEEDRSLMTYYETQLGKFIQQVKDLSIKVDMKEDERINCEERLHELELKFNSLSKEFTLLKNNLTNGV